MKEKLLLHVCCAPDQAYVVSVLQDVYDVRCLFSNPNIQPEEEYVRRLGQARFVAEHYGVALDAPPYRPQCWDKAIEGCEHTPEGGERCRRCFLLRLRETAKFCSDVGWPAFTSTMSISPHKNASLLEETGRTAAREYGVSYVPFDFKKKDGFKKSVVLSRELGLYRQDYCGCRLSYDERQRRKGKARNR
jgi:predicted adenine nucleotide alpha hydrolase (AANH) superfamily ATPase